MIILLAACQQQEEQFQNFVSSLPQCKTPLTISGGFVQNTTRIECISCKDSILFEQYNFGTVIFGRLFSEQKYITVLSGQIAEFDEPFLHTFSAEGQKIDSLFIGGGNGGEDTYWTVTETQIDNNCTITSIDTTWLWNSASRRAYESDSTIIEITQHKILGTGHFILINKTRHSRKSS